MFPIQIINLNNLMFQTSIPHRMKREVRSSVVERGVAERSRLMNVYEQRSEELRKQHDLVRNSFAEHKTMVIATESH